MAHVSNDSAHSEILIRRSALNGYPVQSGTGFSLLRVGEVAYSFLRDSEDDGFGNGGDRLYIGTGTESYQSITNGEGDSATRFYSSEIDTIGGKYFTDMMNHQRGIVEPASALLVDDNKKLNELLVDFLYFDKDSVSTEATNDLTLRGGTGNVIINSNLQVDFNLNVDGITTLDSTTISEDLYVQGFSYLDSAIVDGNLQVTGDLLVNGTTTTINSTEVTIADKRLVIADGTLDSAMADGAGIAVGDSDNELAFMTYRYNGGDAFWEFKPGIVAPDLTVNELVFETIDCGTYA